LIAARWAIGSVMAMELQGGSSSVVAGVDGGPRAGSGENARYFIGDDKRARQISERQGLKAVGTVRLLARLSLEPAGEDASPSSINYERN
jgi:hypothetical protein